MSRSAGPIRWWVLYLRSRSAPGALAAAVASGGGLWAISHAAGDQDARGLLALLAGLAGVAALAPGLAGADPDLDRTAAVAWLPRRAGHVLVGAAAVVGILAAAGLTGDPLAPARLLVRQVVGLAGLTALGAVTTGASRAWLLPAAMTVAVAPVSPPFGTPPRSETYQLVLTWLVQPPGTTAATVTAAALGGAGVLAYACCGARR